MKIPQYLHRVSIKNKQNYFCYNYVKLPTNLTIFGTKMAYSLKLYEVHSLSTSLNSCQCTTVVKRRCSKLSHNAVGLIISIRLLTLASSIPVARITYTVLVEMLNPAQSINQCIINSTEGKTRFNYFVV